MDVDIYGAEVMMTAYGISGCTRTVRVFEC